MVLGKVKTSRDVTFPLYSPSAQAQFAQQQYGQGQQFGRQDSAGGYDYNQYAQYQQQYGGYGSGFQQQDGCAGEGSYCGSLGRAGWFVVPNTF